MSAVRLDGRTLAREMIERLKPLAEAVAKAKGKPARLTALSVGANPGSDSYVKSKAKTLEAAGIELRVAALPAESPERAVASELAALARDPDTDGILIEQPLPSPLDILGIAEALPDSLDPEGISPMNRGRFFAVKSYAELSTKDIIVPCTALAAIEILRENLVPVSGRRAVVIGRSLVVGKPAALLLAALDATVTVCHSKTKNLQEEVFRADIVVACAGRPRMIPGAWIKPGAAVIDVGINEIDGKLCGDVDHETAEARAGFITPVPGGVGPVTAAVLAANTLTLAEKRYLKA